MQSMCRDCKEKVSLTPLYYLDTLINPDSCLDYNLNSFKKGYIDDVQSIVEPVSKTILLSLA